MKDFLEYVSTGAVDAGGTQAEIRVWTRQRPGLSDEVSTQTQ